MVGFEPQHSSTTRGVETKFVVGFLILTSTYLLSLHSLPFPLVLRIGIADKLSLGWYGE